MKKYKTTVTVRRFSKLQDEEFYERAEARKKSANVTPYTLGTLGGILGAGAGVPTGSGKIVLAGAGLGAGLGYLGGKAIRKSVHRKEDERIRKYRGASEEDKKYLQDREKQEIMENLQRRQIHATRQAGWYAGRRW